MTTSDAGRADTPARYDIRLQGHLAPRWSAWLDDLELVVEPDGTTVLRGVLTDQAALHGLLTRLRDLGLPLLSVVRVEPEATKRPETAADPSTTGD